MDAGVCRDQLKEEVDSSRQSLEKLNVNKGAVDVEPPSVVAPKGSSLGPITPDPNRENGDSLFHFQSPLTMLSSPPNLVFPHDPNCSPRTPKEGVFDPFAPGPDDMVLAPRCNKYLAESRIRVARRLHFDSSANFSVGVANRSNDDAQNLSDEDEDMLLESVYGSLLEAIVLKQTEGVLAEISPPELNPDGFMTPTSATRLNGVAETCPGAPTKPTRKLRNIDSGLCRKLEF